MKSNYIKPEVSVIVLEIEMMLAASVIISNGHVDEELTKGRRGTWGNLWDE